MKQFVLVFSIFSALYLCRGQEMVLNIPNDQLIKAVNSSLTGPNIGTNLFNDLTSINTSSNASLTQDNLIKPDFNASKRTEIGSIDPGVVEAEFPGVKNKLNNTGLFSDYSFKSEIIGPDNVCEKYPQFYSAKSDSGLSSRWLVEGGTIGGPSDKSKVTVSWGAVGAGKVTLIQTNIQGVSDTAVLVVNIHPRTFVSINGPGTAPDSTEQVYQATIPELDEYTWTVTGGTIVGKNDSSSVRIKWGSEGEGSIKVSVANKFGCKYSTSQTIFIKPRVYFKINGKDTACQYDTDIYETFYDKDMEYDWSVTNGLFKVGDSPEKITIRWEYSGTGTIWLIRSNVGTKCRVDTVFFNVQVIPQPQKPKITQEGPELVSSSDQGNQWFFNSDIIPGAVLNRLIPDKQGVYTVQVTDPYGCLSEISDETVIKFGTSVDERPVDDVNVFPNPGSGKFTVSLPEKLKQKFSVKISNMLGRTVYSDESAYTNGQNLQFDIGEIPGGYYMLEIIAGENIYKSGIILHK